MTEEEHVKLLVAIRELALLPYSYAANAPRVDSRLVLGLGQIAGLANKILAEHEPRVTWPPPCASS
jgi:hypothetical protein